MFQVSTYYDGKLRHTANYSDALTAVHAFDKCVDYGFANEYATYNLLEPNGKMHTKNFFKNGEVSGK